MSAILQASRPIISRAMEAISVLAAQLHRSHQMPHRPLFRVGECVFQERYVPVDQVPQQCALVVDTAKNTQQVLTLAIAKQVTIVLTVTHNLLRTLKNTNAHLDTIALKVAKQ
jgi:hypothetical protein